MTVRDAKKLRAGSARFPISVLDLMQRLRHKGELSKIVSTLTERVSLPQTQHG
jgi:hypothetical protein